MIMSLTTTRLRSVSAAIALALLLVAPACFTIIGMRAFSSAKGAYWMEQDPDMFYFVSGLNLACGQGSFFNDHPGMGLKYLIAGVIRSAHPFLSDDALRLTVLAHSELYMRVINVVMLLTLAALAWLTALALLRATGDIVIAIAAQTGPLFYAEQYLYFSQKIAAELLLVVLAQALCLVCAMVLADKRAERHAWRYALLCAFICALATATKMNFAPLLVIPCFVVPKLRWKALYIVAGVALFCLFVAPVPMPELLYLFRNSLSSGAHARGQVSLIPPNLLPTLKNFVSAEQPFFAVLGVSGVLAIFGLLGAMFSSRVRQSRVWLILLGVACGATLQVIGVAKNVYSYYMIPAFGLCGLLLALNATLATQLAPWGRIVPRIMAYGLIAGALYFGLLRNTGVIMKSVSVPPVRYMRLTAFYDRLLRDPRYDAVIMEGGTVSASHPSALFTGDIHEQPIMQNRYAIGTLYPHIYHYAWWFRRPACIVNNGEWYTAGAILRQHTNVLFVTRQDELYEFRRDQLDLVATSGEAEVAYCFKPFHIVSVAEAAASQAETNMELDRTLLGTAMQPILMDMNMTNAYVKFSVCIPETTNYNVICNYATRVSRTIDMNVNGITYAGIGIPATPGNSVRHVRRLLIPNVALGAGTNILCLSSRGVMPNIQSIAITR